MGESFYCMLMRMDCNHPRTSIAWTARLIHAIITCLLALMVLAFPLFAEAA